MNPLKLKTASWKSKFGEWGRQLAMSLVCDALGMGAGALGATGVYLGLTYGVDVLTVSMPESAMGPARITLQGMKNIVIYKG